MQQKYLTDEIFGYIFYIFGLTGCVYRDCSLEGISFLCWLTKHECVSMIFNIMVKCTYDQILGCLC
jgi:hypothetical protein